MSEDFYDNMKKEQEILDHSYRESVRQKNERIIHVPTRMKHWEDEMYNANAKRKLPVKWLAIEAL